MTILATIDKYRVEAEIGHGGFATVYRAYDPALRRRLAIKVPHPHLAGDPAALARFTSEAQLAAGLNHRHIVTIYEIGTANGLPYIAMELLDGLPFGQWLAQARPRVEEALGLLAGVGAALDHAHQHKVIHRDVKPSNILVVPGRGAVLGDFGIARALDSAARSMSVAMGTPTYMAPEQVQGGTISAATDIYAFGVLLYELVAGRPPFTGESSAALMAQHAAVLPPDPRTFRPTIPAPAAALLLRALAKDPAQRPASAEALVRDLAAQLSGQAPGQASAPPRRSRQRAWGWLAGVATMLLAVAVWLLLRGGQTGGPAATQPSPAPLTTTVATAAPPGSTLPPLTPQEALLTGGSNLYIEYILDASGSMLEPIGGQSKLAVARAVLATHLRAQPIDTNFGLRVYGHRVHYTDTSRSCQDVELVAPILPGQGERIAAWLATMQAQGMSPVGLALHQAAGDFEMVAGRDNRIVLISDGKETCGIDPCQEVERLQAQGLHVIVHVIGLNLDAEAQTQLQCVARQSGGQYQDARSPGDLQGALDKVSQPQPAAPPSTPEPPAASTVSGPSPTRRSSATAAPTPEPTRTATKTVGPPTATATPGVVVRPAILDLRAGPGFVYPVVGRVRAGDPLAVLSSYRERLANGYREWYEVCCAPGGVRGWAPASEVTSPGAVIPTATWIPPAPTATVTRRPTPIPPTATSVPPPPTQPPTEPPKPPKPTQPPKPTEPPGKPPVDTPVP